MVPCLYRNNRGRKNISASVMEELLAEVNLCSGAGSAELDRLASDQRELLIQASVFSIETNMYLRLNPGIFFFP